MTDAEIDEIKRNAVDCTAGDIYRLVDEARRLRDENARILRGELHPDHRWTTGPLPQCKRCGVYKAIINGVTRIESLGPCDPQRIAGRVELCCECGEDYPVQDLIEGHIYCPKCRAAKDPFGAK